MAPKNKTEDNIENSSPNLIQEHTRIDRNNVKNSSISVTPDVLNKATNYLQDVFCESKEQSNALPQG